MQIGLLPNTGWLKGTIGLTKYGEIEADSRGQTLAPGIFGREAVARCYYKQIIIAMGEGAKASLSAFGHLIGTSAPK